MEKQTPILPANSWKTILGYIRAAGEGESVTRSDIGDDFEFLESIGIFENVDGLLTSAGRVVFEAEFIRKDRSADETLQALLLGYPPTIAIQQYLWGVRDIGIDQVLTTLKATGFWMYSSNQPLTHFLDLLNRVGIISYARKTRQIEVMISPDVQRPPQNVFIDPTRPFSNILWMKRVLAECEDFIYWFDKHFQKEALEWLWATADANKIKEIQILSLDLGDANLNSDAKKMYARFKKELENKGIKVTWATIDSSLVRDSHDRWLIGGNGYLRNIPNVNAVSSGQRSEMNASDNYDEVLSVFVDYFKKGREIE